MKVIKGQKAEQWKKNQGISSKWELIQQLIPLGLKAVEAELQAEVKSIVGENYSRKEHSLRRWGSNDGSVYLADSKVRVKVPRIRDVETKEEMSLESYRQLQKPRVMEEIVFNRVLKGISQRDYESVALRAPEVFGIKKSSISKKFIKASAKKLKSFFERRFDGEDFVAIFIDGKSLLDTMMVVALGIRLDGSKSVLGFVEAATEHHKPIMDFLRSLQARGLKIEHETLFIIDGSKGLRKGIEETFGSKAFFQRCQWHKRENVVSHLPEKYRDSFRMKMQAAYNKQQYVTAKRALLVIQKELKWHNESAANSLLEGLEDTLTLHRLNLFAKLGTSLKTTNPIENVNRLLENVIGKVCHWKNSNQRQRWVASAALELEPRLRKIKGHQFLGELRSKMRAITRNSDLNVLAGAA
jgi:transposase-like protein